MQFTRTHEDFARQLASLNGNPYSLYLLGTLDGARGRAAWQAANRRRKREQALAEKSIEQAIVQAVVESASEEQKNS